jgi:hypothetical protein
MRVNRTEAGVSPYLMTSKTISPTKLTRFLRTAAGKRILSTSTSPAANSSNQLQVPSFLSARSSVTNLSIKSSNSGNLNVEDFQKQPPKRVFKRPEEFSNDIQSLNRKIKTLATSPFSASNTTRGTISPREWRSTVLKQSVKESKYAVLKQAKLDLVKRNRVSNNSNVLSSMTLYPEANRNFTVNSSPRMQSLRLSTASDIHSLQHNVGPSSIVGVGRKNRG